MTPEQFEDEWIIVRRETKASSETRGAAREGCECWNGRKWEDSHQSAQVFESQSAVQEYIDRHRPLLESESGEPQANSYIAEPW